MRRGWNDLNDDPFSLYGEDVRRDMLLAEAQEYGLVADDATDARTIPDDVLGELGLTAQEVGQ